jgi:hypothetical protein
MTSANPNRITVIYPNGEIKKILTSILPTFDDIRTLLDADLVVPVRVWNKHNGSPCKVYLPVNDPVSVKPKLKINPLAEFAFVGDYSRRYTFDDMPGIYGPVMIIEFKSEEDRAAYVPFLVINAPKDR